MLITKKIRQQEPLGPAVSLDVAHPASLLCIGGGGYLSSPSRFGG